MNPENNGQRVALTGTETLAIAGGFGGVCQQVRMAYRASSFRNVLLSVIVMEDILHSLWWDKISALSIALCMTIRFLIQIVSVLVVFICRLDTIAGGCVFDCAEN